MEEKLHETDKIEDVVMPGFRFHPTDEELVGFYLKRKIQQRQLPVELIKQVDIYKYDPWDLPKLASTGEKEWYFYCPRDRKYRNSVRPNRVTGAGFWKATGTDRPIYSSDGTKCVGLKKSLVFYRGRASKGFKTDWMMHEFRLPSSSSSSSSPPPPANNPKKFLDKTLPPNDEWAICRIFKKATSNAQRALAQAWLIPLADPSSSSEMLSQSVVINNQPFSSETVSYSTDIESSMQYCDTNNLQLQHNSCTTSTSSALNVDSCQHSNPMGYKPCFLGDLPDNFMLSQQDILELTNNYTLDSASVLHTITWDSVTSENIFSSYSQQNYNDFSVDSSPEIEEMGLKRQRISTVVTGDHQPSEETASVGFPFSLPSNLGNAWKPHLAWESPNCPNELSTVYSTSKCYT